MANLDGPSSYFLDLSRIFEQLKRDQFSSVDRTSFYYYIRSPKEARGQQIPAIADKQITLIKQLAAQSGFRVSEPGYDTNQNLRLQITITDGDLFSSEYNKFAALPKNLKYISEQKQNVPPTIYGNTVDDKTKPHDCYLSLKDVELRLKIGENEARTIGRLTDDKYPHKLMVALANQPPGTKIKHLEVFPDGSQPNLWQVITKSGYSYLAPFFKSSKGSISFEPHIKLTKTEIQALLSKVNEKYRKKFDGIVASL